MKEEYVESEKVLSVSVASQRRDVQVSGIVGAAPLKLHAANRKACAKILKNSRGAREHPPELDCPMDRYLLERRLTGIGDIPD